ncbi:POT family MFS transporter [Pelomyxa schiedti]|nr:POT family MFS transporter [Pelomyxa schiedti]
MSETDALLKPGSVQEESSGGEIARGKGDAGNASGEKSVLEIQHRTWQVNFIFILVAGRSFAQGISSITPVYFRDWLGCSTSVSSAIANVNLAVYYGSGLVGGALADTFAGHFSVISLGCLIALISLTILVGFSMFVESIGITVTSLLFFYASGVMGPSVSAFIGDQFLESQSVKRTSAYSWYYLWYSVAGIPSTILLPIIFDITEPWVAFLLCLIAFLIVMLPFFLPAPLYDKRPPKRGTYVIVCKIFWSALRKCFMSKESSHSSFLDRAKEDNDPERVEDVKMALRVLSIFLTLPLFWGIFFQINSLWIFQASDMDCNIGGWVLPYAEVGCLNSISDVILIPIFDRIVYPLCKRLGMKVTPLRKMVSGLCATVAAVLVAGLVQLAIERNPDDLLPVSLIIPQYVIVSIAEVLLSVTAYDFAYSEAPSTMRGFLTSMWFLTIALGNGVTACLALIPFASSTTSFLLAGLTVVITVAFCFFAVKYKYKNKP